MENDFLDFRGAEVTYSDLRPKPYNPLNRPPVRYGRAALCVLLWLAGGCLFGFVFWFALSEVWPAAAAAAVWSVLFFLVIKKRAAIWLIHLYQNKAKDETRLKCVFEPSCSEYMIAAIEKYGFFRGTAKGIKRLKRCHPPNGGFDPP